MGYRLYAAADVGAMLLEELGRSHLSSPLLFANVAGVLVPRLWGFTRHCGIGRGMAIGLMRIAVAASPDNIQLNGLRWLGAIAVAEGKDLT